VQSGLEEENARLREELLRKTAKIQSLKALGSGGGGGGGA